MNRSLTSRSTALLLVGILGLAIGAGRASADILDRRLQWHRRPCQSYCQFGACSRLLFGNFRQSVLLVDDLFAPDQFGGKYVRQRAGRHTGRAVRLGSNHQCFLPPTPVPPSSLRRAWTRF